ncbi:MAG: cupin domain-containing protein [Melioribacteraceae bacterium]
MNAEAKKIVDKFGMIKHPEGGFFRETYRSDEILSRKSLPPRFDGERNFSTSIYFLLDGEQKSLFHRLKSDEIWHFYKGSVIHLHLLEGTRYSLIKIGNRIEEEELPQYTIKRGSWFAAEAGDTNSFSFVGCTVSPGFDFKDFEMAQRSELTEEFPDYKSLIDKFTEK